MADAFFFDPFGSTTISGGTGSEAGTPFSLATRRDTTISGNVTNSEGDPLVREVRLYRHKEWLKYGTTTTFNNPEQITTSDSYGSYTFALHDDHVHEYVAVCIGETDENLLVFSHIRLPENKQ